MKHTLKILATTITFLVPTSSAFAEDVLIYSYSKTGQSQAEWALMPIVTDIGANAPETIFDALKKRKMPTYGGTLFDAQKNVVHIDPNKCAYSSIISGEIAHSFRTYGYRQPAFVCGNERVTSAEDQLAHFVVSLPLWQALTMNKITAPVLIQVGKEWIDAAEFNDRLARHDKKLASAIEASFGDGDSLAKGELMKGYIEKSFPNAEKRIAKELGAKQQSTVTAAMTALASTKNQAIIKQMREMLAKAGSSQQNYALALLNATDSTLREDALVILLKSSNDANFNRAKDQLASGDVISFFKKHLKEILSVSTSAHAAVLTSLSFEKNASAQLLDFLKHADCTSEQAQVMASIAIVNSGGDTVQGYTSNSSDILKNEILRVALSITMASKINVTAFDALDDMLANPETRNDPSIWIRGLSSPFESIREASAERLEACSELNKDGNDSLLEAFSDVESPVSAFLPEATVTFSARISDNKTVPESILEKRAKYLKLPVDDKEWTISQEDPVLEGARLMGMGKVGAADAIVVAGAQVYHDSVVLRRDLAYTTRWFDRAGDSMRTALLKDTDESVVVTLIRQFPKRPKDEMTTAMIKEITTRAEQSSRLKIAALHVLPRLMNEKTSHAVTTYAGNEMFDTDPEVRIAAIRALGEIAVISEDPVVSDNAITSLALTAQDKSDDIVHHTLAALARTRNPAVIPILQRALQTHPSSARHALALYPIPGL